MAQDPAEGAAEAEATEPATVPSFESATEQQIPAEVLTRRICDFDLRIEGRPLGRIIERFQAELQGRGITRLQPRFYLSDEWGVPEGTVAIAIPFYLADEQLLQVQEARGGIVEGGSEEDILRYLRHEMGHVVNYAYQLYVADEWTALFGPMARPYTEQYRALPFSPDFVRHLPGNYAQKHPDEDWAETYAVWMTPGLDWRTRYADSPGALAKLEWCERVMRGINERDPVVVCTEIDYEASQMKVTVQEYYDHVEVGATTVPRSLDGDLQMIFAPRLVLARDEPGRLGSAALLLRRNKDLLANAVYQWTGADPSILRQLLHHLERRAGELELTYRLGQRDAVLVQISGFLTTLAMNYVYRGNFIAS